MYTLLRCAADLSHTHPSFAARRARSFAGVLARARVLKGGVVEHGGERYVLVAAAARAASEAGSADVALLCRARLLFCGPVRVPRTPPELPASAEQGGGNGTGTDGRRHYTLPPLQATRADSVLPLHLAQLADFLAAPVNVDRGPGIKVHGARTLDGAEQTLRRYLGWVARQTGVGFDGAAEQGLLLVGDGELVAAWAAWLLGVRQLSIESVAGELGAIIKGASFCAAVLAPGRSVAFSEHATRLHTLASQLSSWATRSAGEAPTYAERLATGRAVPLEEVLAATLPAIDRAAALWNGSVQAALRVRNAAILAVVAGDALPNVRPSELQFLRDWELDGGCLLASHVPGGCTDDGCRGSSVRLEEDGCVLFEIVHHKTAGTAGRRQLRAAAGTRTARIWALLLTEAREHVRRPLRQARRQQLHRAREA